jgi:2',3'-cyclic-nucleotide 2'-phosphodiesterase (5'-nucleotidase family)
VFEMMPFDNQLVVQRLPGSIVQEFLDTVASRGGWPGSGVAYVIRNHKATQVMIKGLPLDTAKVYIVANSDYVVNGGDNCTMLVNFPQENKGFLVRDALIDYFRNITASGQKISSKLENRVKNVD